MGRNSRKGLNYFTIDCDQEDKLNYLEARHGIVGYGVLVKLWKTIYQFNGYYCLWDIKNMYLFSKDIQVPITTIQEVVETCFEEQLFNRELFDKFQILTSEGIQKRWQKFVIRARRKDIEIDSQYCLLSFPAEDRQLFRRKCRKLRGKCLKEKKRKEKEIILAPAEPSQVNEFVKSSEKKNPGWPALAQAWRDLDKIVLNKPRLFSGDKSKLFKSILTKRNASAEQQWKAWKEYSAMLVLTELFLRKNGNKGSPNINPANS